MVLRARTRLVCREAPIVGRGIVLGVKLASADSVVRGWKGILHSSG